MANLYRVFSHCLKAPSTTEVVSSQVLTAVGYNNRRPVFPDYIDKDVVVRPLPHSLIVSLGT